MCARAAPDPRAVRAVPTAQICYSKGGMMYITKWGTLRHTMNIAFGQTLQAKALLAQGNATAARNSM